MRAFTLHQKSLTPGFAVSRTETTYQGCLTVRCGDRTLIIDIDQAPRMSDDGKKVLGCEAETFEWWYNDGYVDDESGRYCEPSGLMEDVRLIRSSRDDGVLVLIDTFPGDTGYVESRSLSCANTKGPVCREERGSLWELWPGDAVYTIHACENRRRTMQSFLYFYGRTLCHLWLEEDDPSGTRFMEPSPFGGKLERRLAFVKKITAVGTETVIRL